MNSKMLVSMKLDKRLAMNQQLKQAINLLQYNTIELSQMVKQQMENNVFIEMDEEEKLDEQDEEALLEPLYSAQMSKKNIAFDQENSLNNITAKKTLRDHLFEQTLLCHFNDNDQSIAEYIIDAIDDNGFIAYSMNELHELINAHCPATYAEIMNILNLIKTFDPIGVGSNNIRECLLTQLNAITNKNEVWKLAYEIVESFDEAHNLISIKKMLKKIKHKHHHYHDALKLIKSLHFYPGTAYLPVDDYKTTPELLVKKIDDHWQVFLTKNILSKIKINQQYHQLISTQKKHPSYAVLRQELDDAKSLIYAIRKRNETLLKVAAYIMSVQTPFLDHGHAAMKPMNISDVARAIEIHESTVSRITNGKFIATPYGIFELKYFFSSYVATKVGEHRSAIAVKSFIKNIISKERPQHIYSDHEITELLHHDGIHIARRTVTKYRESMKLLSSYERQVHYQSLRLEHDEA